MRRFRWLRMTLLSRIILFLTAFGVAMALQIGIGYYQTAYVLKPLEQRSERIQTISQFLNDVEACMTALENYRWDYGDTAALLRTVQDSRQRSAGYLEHIDADLRVVSEEQYLLTNAARTTYRTLDRTLDGIIREVSAGRSAQASHLYYDSAERCGTYLRQYTQQLLEQACFDSQGTHTRLVQLNERLQQAQAAVVFLCVVLGAMLVMSLMRLFWAVSALAQASQAISRGEYDTPDLNETRDDETGHMARAFNEMKRSTKRKVELLEEKRTMESRLHAKEMEAMASASEDLLKDADSYDKTDLLMGKVKKYLQHNYMAYDISLDSVSAILNLSPAYFSTLFKRTFQVNFLDYLTELRMEAAKELLGDPLRSTADVAGLVGCESANYFTRAFKKRVGMTPSDYRRTAAQSRGGIL